MALINCPECGTRVSDTAMNCPSCGYPINMPVAKAVIRFDKPFIIRYKCTVICEGNEYRCKQGEAIAISLTRPTQVTIKVSGCGSCTCSISPNGRYHVESGFGITVYEVFN